MGNKKTKFRDRYVSMSDIGRKVGMSARAIGAKLKELNLREANGDATAKALEDGLAVFTPLKDGTKHYMWDKHKVVQLLGGSGVDTSPEHLIEVRIRDTIRTAITEVDGWDEDDIYVQKFGYELLHDIEHEVLGKKLMPLMLTHYDFMFKTTWSSCCTPETKIWLLEWLAKAKERALTKQEKLLAKEN